MVVAGFLYTLCQIINVYRIVKDVDPSKLKIGRRKSAEVKSIESMRVSTRCPRFRTMKEKGRYRLGRVKRLCV